jgi:hypothetical protein
MHLLTVLTLCWVAVLVAAVAASLIAVLVRLLQIAHELRSGRDALVMVRDRTSLLDALLRPLTQIGGEPGLPHDRKVPSGTT